MKVITIKEHSDGCKLYDGVRYCSLNCFLCFNGEEFVIVFYDSCYDPNALKEVFSKQLKATANIYGTQPNLNEELIDLRRKGNLKRKNYPLVMFISEYGNHRKRYNYVLVPIKNYLEIIQNYLKLCDLTCEEIENSELIPNEYKIDLINELEEFKFINFNEIDKRNEILTLEYLIKEFNKKIKELKK